MLLALLLLAVEPYEADVRFAAAAIEEKCHDLLRTKKIDWKKVSAPFLKEAKSVRDDRAHLLLLVRLLARLEDGHAGVVPLEKGKGVELPAEPERSGPGLFLCRSGKRILVKNAWAGAAEAGARAGMEVLSVEGIPAANWLERRVADLSDRIGFSTPQQAFYYACHWGLGFPKGRRLEFDLRDGQDRVRRTIPCDGAGIVALGPAFPPPGLAGDGDVRHGTTAGGFGYIHLRRCPKDLPERIDRALEALKDPEGLVLDFRANGGGGFDHEALLGRFVPKGRTLDFGNRYESAGPAPYGGPVVAIVDAGVRSAGETAAGIFKEDGRAYVIGESATAGMSSRKTTIELPSRLFGLYVSVSSNKGRFNGGKGIEGIGVPPHEIVEYDAADLAKGVDTLLRRAEELLRDFPEGKVPYRPDRAGRPPKPGR